MEVKQNFSLKNYNTFGIAVSAKQFLSITSTEELTQVLQQLYAKELLVLGGGSNILLTDDIEKIVLHIQLKGIEILRETEEEVFVRVQAGENWHEFVQWCVAHDFGGLENLSLIPGNVGTSPIQNIGAYGVELKDTFAECEALHVQTAMVKTFSKKDCQFDYRNSIFKNELKGQYIITSVVFCLSKKNHKLHTGYGAILSELDKRNIKAPTIQDISEVVVAIRQAKLPDPNEIGNSGSFFKNPVISAVEFEKLKTRYPEVPSYKVSENEIKVPAGWLIDQAGFKGYRVGDAGVHKRQALVLVNYGTATGQEVLALSQRIQQKIFELFAIRLHTEVNILP